MSLKYESSRKAEKGSDIRGRGSEEVWWMEGDPGRAMNLVFPLPGN
jgi:hypothetical protein